MAVTLHIVQPACRAPSGGLIQSKKRWVIGMTLPYLAALAPRGYRVRVIDDRLYQNGGGERPDLVMMTLFTESARRGYELARGYRRQGIPVVIGGWHATFYPEEAAGHADAVARGEGEMTWRRILADFEAGRLQERYEPDGFHDMKSLPMPRYDLLNLRQYVVKYFPIQTSRGCPFSCSFCEVSHMYGRKYRIRPMDEVIEEIRACPSRRIQFIDDNLASDKDYTKELLRRLIPLKIKWTGLWTMRDSLDEELLDLAKRSGCWHINMGIESIDPESLKDMGKRQNRVPEYEKALALLNRKGFFYSLNFIFGWDSDSPDIFQKTADFLDRNRVPMAFFSILTPRKGTKIYDQLVQEGRMRIINQIDNTGIRCFYEPKRMTGGELEEGIWKTYRMFYSWGSIRRRRVFTIPRVGYHEVVLSNLVFRRCVRKGIEPLEYY